MGSAMSWLGEDCLGCCVEGDAAARGTKEEEAAATKIQAAYRGSKVRKEGSGSAGSGRQGSFKGKFD